MANFTTDISFGDLNPKQCKYITYQAKVDDTAVKGDEFKVVNEFKYETEEYKPTNEVLNQITNDVVCSLSLSANPVDGSTVYRGDYIEYSVQCKNTGPNTIQSGSIDCVRQKNTAETDCKLGQCTPATFQNLAPNAVYKYVYSVQVGQSLVDDTTIGNICSADYDNQKTDSNPTTHTVDVPVNSVA